MSHRIVQFATVPSGGSAAGSSSPRRGVGGPATADNLYRDEYQRLGRRLAPPGDHERRQGHKSGHDQFQHPRHCPNRHGHTDHRPGLEPPTDHQHRVIIDGYSQTGASRDTLANGDNATLLIELSGKNEPTNSSGLTISAGGSTVRGLVIDGFTTDSRDPGWPRVRLDTKGDVVTGNFFGSDPTGTLLSNAETASGGNGISGNPIGGGGNTIEGNLFIGSGTNAGAIDFFLSGASGNELRASSSGRTLRHRHPRSPPVH